MPLNQKPLRWPCCLAMACLFFTAWRAIAAEPTLRFAAVGPQVQFGLTELEFDADGQRLYARGSRAFFDEPALWRRVGAGPWRNITAALPGGEIARLAFAADPETPGRLWAVASNSQCQARVLVSSDGGSTWETRVSGLDRGCSSALAVEPSADIATTTLWAGFGGDVTRSDDGGRTWHGTAFDFSSTQWIVPIPAATGSTGALLVGEWGGVYRSTDRGETFEQVLSAGGVAQISSDGQVVIEHPSGACLAWSGDAGATFEMRAGPPGVTECAAAQITLAAGNRLILVDRSSDNPSVWRSDDFGLSWQLAEMPRLPEEGRLVADPRTAGRFFVLGREISVWEKEPGAVTWRRVGAGLRLAAVRDFTRAGDREWAVVERPGLGSQYLWRGEAGRWTRALGEEVSAFAIDPFDPDHLFVAVTRGPVPPFGASEGRILESRDGGSTFSGGGERLPDNPPAAGRPWRITRIVFDPQERGHAFALTLVAGLLERRPGTGWARAEQGFPVNRQQCWHGYCSSIPIGPLVVTPEPGATAVVRVGTRLLARAADRAADAWRDLRFPGGATAVAVGRDGSVFATDDLALYRSRAIAPRAWSKVAVLQEPGSSYHGSAIGLTFLATPDGASLVLAATDQNALLAGSIGGGFTSLATPAPVLGFGDRGSVLLTQQGAYDVAVEDP
jgi:hypothetical protein